MKQISLANPSVRPPVDAPCAGKSFLVWGVYGWSMLCLWRLAQGHPWAEAAAWTVAIAAGAVLALALRDA